MSPKATQRKQEWHLKGGKAGKGQYKPYLSFNIEIIFQNWMQYNVNLSI